MYYDLLHGVEVIHLGEDAPSSAGATQARRSPFFTSWLLSAEEEEKEEEGEEEEKEEEERWALHFLPVDATKHDRRRRRLGCGDAALGDADADAGGIPNGFMWKEEEEIIGTILCPRPEPFPDDACRKKGGVGVGMGSVVKSNVIIT